MRRAISISQLYKTKRNLLAFDGAFAASFGTPELKGTWFIAADSGSGKTTFVLKLCKYLAKFARVAYDSFEEGDGYSFELACKRVGMQDVNGKFILLNKEQIPELKERLRKHKAPQVVVIDSIQYTKLRWEEYLEMVEEFPNVLFIIISQSEGRKLRGELAKDIRFDAMIKIRVEGYVAFVTSRYGGGKPFVIWEKGAQDYHGFDLENLGKNEKPAINN